MTNNHLMTEKTKPRGRPQKDVTLDKKQQIRCLEMEKGLWKDAAALSPTAKNTSDWARTVLNREAKKILAKAKKTNGKL